MTSHTTTSFKKSFAKLPDNIKQKAKSVYRIWIKDPHNKVLQFKKIHKTKPIYSVRIDINYRVLGIISGNTIVWFWIGSHSDYDKIISQL